MSNQTIQRIYEIIKRNLSSLTGATLSGCPSILAAICNKLSLPQTGSLYF
jgi:hypothetical protein